MVELPALGRFDGARIWAESGAMALTGRADGPPLAVPASVGARVAALGDALARASERLGTRVAVDAPALLAERAALTNGSRGGATSVGGSCRLLQARDGWIGVNLPRDDDFDLVPAWLDAETAGDPWAAVSAAIAGRAWRSVVNRAAELGLAVSGLGEVGAVADPVVARSAGSRQPRTVDRRCLVVDLSSLWAGPLAANLLGLAGARVIKVESSGRPDGARSGSAALFDLLHGGHESVALDFRTVSGRRALRRLVEHADVVIEASRPRALEQLDLAAEQVLTTSRVGVWLSITAHGRAGANANRIGYGDDAAVAGGLVAWDTDGPCFAADAVSDPVTGLLAANVVLDRLGAGGRWLVEIALSRTAAWLFDGSGRIAAGESAIAPPRAGGVAAGEFPVAPPRARPVTARAPALGAHTAAVLAEFGIDA